MYKCEECNIDFTRKTTLKRHRETSKAHRNHSSEVCSDCDEVVTRKDLLARHRKIHTGSDLKTCSRCNRDFARGYYLREHLRSCRKRFRPALHSAPDTQKTSATQTRPVVWQDLTTVEETKSRSLKLSRPARSVRDAPLFTPLDLARIDLSEENGLLEHARDSIEKGDVPRLERIVSSLPFPLNSVLGLDEAFKANFLKHYRGVDYTKVTDFYRGWNPIKFNSFNASLTHCAARWGHVSIMEYLRKSGIDLNDRICHAWNGLITPLHVAAHYGRNDMLEYLLDDRADMEAENRNGVMPLHFAATIAILLGRGVELGLDRLYDCMSDPCHSTERLRIAKLLIERRIIVGDARSDKLELVFWAAAEDDLDMINFLLDAGFSVDAHSNDRHSTPLSAAIEWGNVEAARLLITRGASVNGVAGDYGTTPWCMAWTRRRFPWRA